MFENSRFRSPLPLPRPLPGPLPLNLLGDVSIDLSFCFCALSLSYIVYWKTPGSNFWAYREQAKEIAVFSALRVSFVNAWSMKASSKWAKKFAVRIARVESPIKCTSYFYSRLSAFGNSSLPMTAGHQAWPLTLAQTRSLTSKKSFCFLAVSPLLSLLCWLCFEFYYPLVCFDLLSDLNHCSYEDSLFKSKMCAC